MTEREEYIKHLCWCQRLMCVSRKSTCAVWGVSSTGLFFTEHQFYLKQLLTDKVWLFRLGYLTDIFSKMSRVSLSHQGKQLSVFATKNKIWAFKQNLEFCVRCVSITVNLTVLCNFSNAPSSDINNCYLISIV